MHEAAAFRNMQSRCRCWRLPSWLGKFLFIFRFVLLDLHLIQNVIASSVRSSCCHGDGDHYTMRHDHTILTRLDIIYVYLCIFNVYSVLYWFLLSKCFTMFMYCHTYIKFYPVNTCPEEAAGKHQGQMLWSVTVLFFLIFFLEKHGHALWLHIPEDQWKLPLQWADNWRR